MALSRKIPLLLGFAVSRAGMAQANGELRARSNCDASVSFDAHTTVTLTLSRPLAADEGELALIVGGMDVTAVSARTASSIVYEPNAVPLPTGRTEVVLFRRSGSKWTEIRRLSVRVAQGAAGQSPSFGGSATLGNKGQVAQGQTNGASAPSPHAFQDFILNGGLRSSNEAGGWTFSTRSNYVGVTRRQDALTFASRGNTAPLLDLSDYSIGVRNSSATFTLGSVTFGNSRHLANNFAARGGTFSLSQGATSFVAGAMSGSPQIGWTDLTGVERPSDRIFGAALAREIVPSQPGALRLDVTFIDGSKQPRPSFTQGAVLDAERSDGGSVQLTATLPSQRARITSGYTRSRFENPATDPQLLGDTLLKRPQPATRGARFVEGNVIALQNVATPFGGPANVSITARDERVDPLFGSVAGQAQADRQADGADATVSIGAISGQLSANWTRDNLGRVQSVLTTSGRSTTANLALPLAAIVGARAQQRAALLPTFTLTANVTRQVAEGTPVNGNFRPTDLPNQVNSTGDASATWQGAVSRVAIHANLANQDNRQPTRENADFDSGVLGLTLGRTLGTRGDVSVDLGDDYQTARERNETTRTRRVTMSGSLRPTASLNVLATLSVLDARLPTGQSNVNTEQHLELSQGFDLGPGRAGDAQRGQCFVRFARTGSLLPPVAATGAVSPTSSNRTQWTVASGLNFRLF